MGLGIDAAPTGIECVTCTDATEATDATMTSATIQTIVERSGVKIAAPKRTRVRMGLVAHIPSTAWILPVRVLVFVILEPLVGLVDTSARMLVQGVGGSIDATALALVIISGNGRVRLRATRSDVLATPVQTFVRQIAVPMLRATDGVQEILVGQTWSVTLIVNASSHARV